MPSLLAAILTYIVYKMLESKWWTPTKIIIAIIVFSLASSYFGILGIMPNK